MGEAISNDIMFQGPLIIHSCRCPHFELDLHLHLRNRYLRDLIPLISPCRNDEDSHQPELRLSDRPPST